MCNARRGGSYKATTAEARGTALIERMFPDQTTLAPRRHGSAVAHAEAHLSGLVIMSENVAQQRGRGRWARPSQHRDRACNRRFRFRMGSGQACAQAADARLGREPGLTCGDARASASSRRVDWTSTALRDSRSTRVFDAARGFNWVSRRRFHSSVVKRCHPRVVLQMTPMTPPASEQSSE